MSPEVEGAANSHLFKNYWPRQMEEPKRIKAMSVKERDIFSDISIQYRVKHLIQ